MKVTLTNSSLWSICTRSYSLFDRQQIEMFIERHGHWFCWVTFVFKAVFMIYAQINQYYRQLHQVKHWGVIPQCSQGSLAKTKWQNCFLKGVLEKSPLKNCKNSKMHTNIYLIVSRIIICTVTVGGAKYCCATVKLLNTNHKKEKWNEEQRQK